MGNRVLVEAREKGREVVVARLVGGGLERAAERRRDSRLGLRELDADHLPIPFHFCPIILMLTVHGGQTTNCSASFNRFGDRAEMATK